MDLDSKYQEESVNHSRISWLWRIIPSGNGILKSGGIMVVLLSRKYLRRSSRQPDVRGNKGGMAQINIPSLQKTMIAVFVANVCPVNS